jgi:predicted MFS family arabinose efflux permease
MPAIATQPVFIASILARMPLAMLTIGMLVHVEHVTGSFAAAGLVSGTLAVAQGAGGPALGRLVDRGGQTAVLLGGALVAGAGLIATAALPAGAPITALIALATVIGLATPPVGPCMRALLPGMVEDEDAQRAAYALDSAAVELTWVSGPPLVLLAGTVLSTGAALVVAGAVLTVSTVLFASTKASRAWRPEPKSAEDATGALRSPGVRTLALALASAGLLFGATEVAVTAAAGALGGTAAAGPLLGLWGVGSLAGGIVVARAGGGARTGAGLAALLAVLAGTHLALAAAAGSMLALCIVIVAAGSMIAPTCATAYAMVDAAAPAGTTTEAFAWLATAIAIGTSAGAAAAGAVADASGPAATFVLAGAAGAIGAAATILRARTITPAGARAALAAA